MPKTKKKATTKKTHHCVTISYKLADYKRLKKQADKEHLPLATYLKKISLEA